MIYIVAIDSPENSYYMFQVVKEGKYEVILPGSIIRIITAEPLDSSTDIMIIDCYIEEKEHLSNSKGSARNIEDIVGYATLEKFYNERHLV